MTPKEIIKKYLKDNGYDGLVSTFGDCGCSVDDLEPCGCINIDECVPAFLKKCETCDNPSCYGQGVDEEGCYYDAENGVE